MIGGATERGICLCEFSDRGGKDRIIARLRKRHGAGVRVWNGSHPNEQGGLSRADRTDRTGSLLHRLESQLGEYFAGNRREFDLDLELGGTPWQRQVWTSLLEIPYGVTRSYGELASALGKPGAGRAVGRANGDNYVAIVVPCHRVIQAGGGLRGYGGGLHRKRWLLDLEAGGLQLTL
jgi:methylated-DNA-[protein]-cysteine S-methyltransferase